MRLFIGRPPCLSVGTALYITLYVTGSFQKNDVFKQKRSGKAPGLLPMLYRVTALRKRS